MPDSTAGPTVGIVGVTPELAETWLSRNPKNRNLRGLAGKAWRKHERKPPVDPRLDAEHDWLRVGEVARMLGLTDKAVTQRLREGRLAGTRKGTPLVGAARPPRAG